MMLDFDDILIKPAKLTRINSRSQINCYDQNLMLPLFTAPMDTVISDKNAKYFTNNGIKAILPRNCVIGTDYISTNMHTWYSYGLEDFERIFIDNTPNSGGEKMYALIDVANGHMPRLLSAVYASKNKYNAELVLMVGNVANPETYLELSIAGADYVRAGIGNGGGCLTTVQTGVGYPMASLIAEMHKISLTLNRPAKIVADGGFKKYSDIIKALALGADYVMLGSILNKALESIGETKINRDSTLGGYEVVDQYSERVKELFHSGTPLYKTFRGMSTKEVQKEWGRSDIKTSEGVVKVQNVEYTISGWVENFTHYLKSAMSYADCLDLNEFIGGPECIQISQNSYNRYNK